MLRSIIFLIAILTVTTSSAFSEAIDYRDTYVLIIGVTKWRDKDIPSALVISPVRDGSVEEEIGPHRDEGKAMASKGSTGGREAGKITGRCASKSSVTPNEHRFGAPAGSFKIGDYVYGLHEDKWLPARIMDFRNDDYTLQFCLCSRKLEETHKKDTIREITFITWQTGDRVKVLWKGSPYDGVIVKVEDDFPLITYQGWPSFWDEWVGYERIQQVNGQKFREASVRDGGEWYPATVLAERDGRSFIHYTGYDWNWDEWVGPERIRR